MNTIRWIAAAELIILTIPLVLMAKYIKEISSCKKAGRPVDHEILLKLIAVSISFASGMLIFMLGTLPGLR